MVDLDTINNNFCVNEDPQDIDIKEVVDDVFVLYQKLRGIVTDKTLFIALDKSARTIMYTLRKMFECYEQKRVPVSFINFSSRDYYSVKEVKNEAVPTRKYGFLKQAIPPYWWKFRPDSYDDLLSQYFVHHAKHYDFDHYDNIIIVDDVYASGKSLHYAKKAIEEVTDVSVAMVSLYKYSGHKPKIDPDLIYARKKDRNNNYKDNFNGIVSDYTYIILQETEDLKKILGCALSVKEKDLEQSRKFLEKRNQIKDRLHEMFSICKNSNKQYT